MAPTSTSTANTASNILGPIAPTRSRPEVKRADSIGTS
jgi:hypothetical protein